MSNTQTAGSRNGPLADLTIIDCTMAYAGPFGTTLLADLGADVIKVEPPGGDMFRTVPPYPPDHAHPWKDENQGVDYGMAFASVNRNKRSIKLDLKQAEDREVLLTLCESADAIVENMRAGVMDQLGLGYEVIRARNAKIVYGAVRGYGDRRTGESPYGEWPCLDVAGQAAGGLVEVTGDLFPVAIADIYPGTLMALGVVSAIHKARISGTGDFFDVSMYDAMMTLIRSNVTDFSLTGKAHKPGRRALVPFGLFPARDGRVAIAAPVERHWSLLCEAMGREDLIEDERTVTNNRRSANQDFTEAEIAAWTSQHSKAEIVAALGGKVPVGPANTIAEILEDPHVHAREMLQNYALPGDNPEVTLTANPIRFADQPTSLYQGPPLLGEHTAEILRQFNINQGEQ